MRWPEFLRQLGADPESCAPEFLAARHSSPRFEEAAGRAEHFEGKLKMALAVPVRPDLLEALRSIPDVHAEGQGTRARSWAPVALAAALMVAVAVGIISQSKRDWESVEDYLALHYSRDGAHLEALAAGRLADEVQTILAGVGYAALPELEAMVGYIKYCPTTDGRGVHMVLHTGQDPVTVILMPSTPVTEWSARLENGMQAVMLPLGRGSIAVLGRDADVVRQLGPLVHASVVRS